MTCYFRHLKTVFEKAGVTVTSENKREIDKAIHKLVGVEYKDCPSTWREVKKRTADNVDAFASQLRQALTKRT